jgi:hypothetical protein
MKFSKTEAGQQAFKARSVLLSARQRSAFILFDGVKSTEQVLASTSGLGISQEDIDHLVEQGFLAAVRDAASVVTPSASRSKVDEAPVLPVSSLTSQERYSAAMPIATKLTASLGLRGFRLNLAVEAARGYDDLLILLPKIQDAVGAKSCVALAQALKA